jgi:lactate permease
LCCSCCWWVSGSRRSGASLITLAVALVIAVLVYGMPIDLALNSTLLGICFGLFPIVWIVINAMFPKY